MFARVRCSLKRCSLERNFLLKSVYKREVLVRVRCSLQRSVHYSEVFIYRAKYSFIFYLPFLCRVCLWVSLVFRLAFWLVLAVLPQFPKFSKARTLCNKLELAFHSSPSGKSHAPRLATDSHTGGWRVLWSACDYRQSACHHILPTDVQTVLWEDRWGKLGLCYCLK